MRRKLRLIVSLITCLCLAFAAGFGTYQLRDRLSHGRRPEQLKVFWEAWDRIEGHFYGDLPSSRERTYGAIRSSLALLDPYTVFVEPQTRELERDRMRGVYGGIGVTLWRDAEWRVVLSPYADSPAERAGVREGDVLLAVDGEAVTTETTIEELEAQFHGEVGTSVTLTLSRSPDESFDLTIARADVQVPSVTWRVLDQATAIGYVHLEQFTERTDDELMSAIEDLRRSGVSSLILDLRGNFGGLIGSAVDVCSQFLETGVVLYQRSHDQERTFEVSGEGIATEIPLVVLVDGQTASAAEIVAGALQDHGRAPLIGELTFGKGSVQQIYDLSDGSSLHVTSAIWLTPDRHQIEGQGLTPDVHVPRDDDLDDEQLNRAVEYLLSELVNG